MPATGSVPATYSDGRGHVGITSLELLDTSVSGLGVRCASPIGPGMIVAIRPDSARGGIGLSWLTALAVRSTRDGNHYRVGLRFARAIAA